MALGLTVDELQQAALVVMHYQTDVFELLFDGGRSPLIERCNTLLRWWRTTGRPLVFANVELGQSYERAPPATNRQITPYVALGRFKAGTPAVGLATVPGDHFYACSRASVFWGTSLDEDLRSRNVVTLVLAGISTTGVVLSSVAWAADADYDVRVVEECCFDPDQTAHQALFGTDFGGRAAIMHLI